MAGHVVGAGRDSACIDGARGHRASGGTARGWRAVMDSPTVRVEQLVSLVVPVFNEAEVIGAFYARAPAALESPGTSTTSSSSSTTAAATTSFAQLDGVRRRESAGPGDQVLAQLRPPDCDQRRHRPRARRLRRRHRRRPAGSARGHCATWWRSGGGASTWSTACDPIAPRAGSAV